MGKKKNKKKEKKTPYEVFREYAVAILICLEIALFVVTFLLHPMAVPTPSMDTPPNRIIPGTGETLGDYNLLVGDRLLVDKLTIMANHFPISRALGIGYKIKRGDVVVFKAPDKRHFLVPYVKRVIGLPGETIEIIDNQVFINGKKLIEPYVYHELGEDAPYFLRNMPPLKIPPHHYFMMGDNRDDSSDSRDWGTVPEDYIFGKPLVIIWSFPDDEILKEAFPDKNYSGVHEVNNPGDIIKLYLYRVIYFYKTRWGRMLHFMRRGNCYFENESTTKRAEN